MLDKLFKPKETYVPEIEEPKTVGEQTEEKVTYWYEVYFKGDYDYVDVLADEVVTLNFSDSLVFKLEGKIVAMFDRQDVLYWIRTDEVLTVMNRDLINENV